MKKIILLGVAALAGFAFATTAPLDSVTSAVGALCCGLTNLLPIVAMLMTILGAVIYASGQVMGAETRARANVWATAALTGALVSMLIFAVAPPVLEAIYNRGGTSMSAACGCVGMGGGNQGGGGNNGGGGNPGNPGDLDIDVCGDSGDACPAGTTCCTTNIGQYLGCCINGQICNRQAGCEGAGQPL